MKRTFKALTGFTAFIDEPMIKKDTILEAEVLGSIFKIGEWRVHESWINHWLGMEYIEEIKSNTK